MSASHLYKEHPYRMKAQGVGDLSGGSTLAEFYSIADCSTTVTGIPILIAGGCWALTSASRRYKERPYRMKTQGVGDLSGISYRIDLEDY